MNRIAVTALGVLGFVLITFVPMSIRSWASTDLLVALAIAGGILFSVAGMRSERLRQTEGDYDERRTEIRFRSGWYAFWFVMAPAWAMLSIRLFTELTIPLGAIAVIGPGGVLVLEGIVLVLKREM